MNIKQGRMPLVRRALCPALLLVLLAVNACAATTVYGSGVVEPVSQPVVFAKVDADVAEILVEMGDDV